MPDFPILFIHYWTHGFTMRLPVEVLYTISCNFAQSSIQLVFILWTGTHVVVQLRAPEMLSLS